MAEDMLAGGDDRIRALLTVAGNPVLSTPNGNQLDRALAGLDYMVSIDLYVNETTRHADLILPPTAALEHDHYDLVFNLLAVRNTARYSAPLFEPAHRRETRLANLSRAGPATAGRFADNSPQGRTDTLAYGPRRPHRIAGPYAEERPSRSRFSQPGGCRARYRSGSAGTLSAGAAVYPGQAHRSGAEQPSLRICDGCARPWMRPPIMDHRTCC